MYSENEKQFSRRRSGDEFLRRLKSDEFLSSMTAGKDIPTFSQSNQSGIPRLDERPRTSCNGTERRVRENTGESFGCGTNQPTCANMPSLAMVYSPVQAFHKLLTPTQGLSQGSIFEELILPFEGDKNDNHCKTGGCNR